jgi:hypothetical protein
MMEGLNDVSNKVAYAYSRYQAYLLVAVVFVVAGLLESYDELDVLPSLFDDVLLLALGIALLVLALRSVDLKRISRYSLVLVGIAFLGKLAASALESPEDRLDEGLWLVSLGGLLVAHFLPRRLGKTVLYSPESVRTLSNVRTLATALWLSLAFSALSVPVLGIGYRSLTGELLVLVSVASFVGLVLYTLLPNGPTLVHLLDAFSGVVLVGALGGLALNLRLGDLFDEELILLVISATALLVTGTLSGRINRGKTIVGHRA